MGLLLLACALGIAFAINSIVKNLSHAPANVDRVANQPVSYTATLLKADSCGCKVFLLEYDGHRFLVNNQGGIVEVEP